MLKFRICDLDEMPSRLRQDARRWGHEAIRLVLSLDRLDLDESACKLSEIDNKGEN